MSSEPTIVYDEDPEHVGVFDEPKRRRADIDAVDNVILKDGHAAAFNEFIASAKNMHEVTMRARADIEAAQQRYRDALARFTQLSVDTAG